MCGYLCHGVLNLGRSGDKQYFFEVAERQYIGFFEWPDVTPLDEKDAGYAVKGEVAFDHVALALESEDELWAAKARIEAAGLWVTEVVDDGFIRSFFTFDPNGISVELSVDTELDLAAEPRLLDRQPPAAAQEESEPNQSFWPASQAVPVEERCSYPGLASELCRHMSAGAREADP
jgi:catechol 2,3-dioxygenase-like lactoylglutathione lyase family enzyme